MKEFHLRYCEEFLRIYCAENSSILREFNNFEIKIANQ